MKFKTLSSSLLLFALSLFLLQGCMSSKRSRTQVPASSSAPKAQQSIDSAQAYDLGLKAFNAGKYTESLNFFRKISRKSPFYPQALKVARQIPFKRAQLAYNEGKFEDAILSAEKIKEGSADFSEAQSMIQKSRYYLQIRKYEAASGEEKSSLLGEVVDQALLLKRSDMLLQSVDAIGKELQNASSLYQTKQLLAYIQKILTVQNKEVLEATLQRVLGSFNSLKKQYPELSIELFQLIRDAKLGVLRS